MKKNIGRIISMLLVCTMICTGNLSTALGADFSGETDIIAEEEIVDAEPCSEDTELCEDSEVCDETELCEEIELLDEADDAEETEDDILSLSAASGESHIFNKGTDGETKLTAGRWNYDRYTFNYDGHKINYALYYSSDISRVFSQSELNSDKVQLIGKSGTSSSSGSFVTGAGITQRAKEEYKDKYFDYTNAGPGYYRYLIYIDEDMANGFLTCPYLADYARTSPPYNLGVDDSGKYVKWNPTDTNWYQVEFYYFDFDEEKYECKYTGNGFNYKTSIPDNYDKARPMYFKVKVYTDQGGWSHWTTSSIIYPSATKGKIKDIHFGDPDKGQDPNKIYWNNNLNSEETYKYYYEAEVHTITSSGVDTILGTYESASSITSTKKDGDIEDRYAFDVRSYESLADIKNPFYVLITAYDNEKKPSSYTTQERQTHALTRQAMSQKFYFWGGSYVQANRQNDGKLTATVRKAVQPNTEFFNKGITNSYSYQWQYYNFSEWTDIEAATNAIYSPTLEQRNLKTKLRVIIRNNDYAGELISDVISAEAAKTVKGYANLTFRDGGDHVIDIPRADTDTVLKVEFVPEEGQGLGTYDLTYVYEWYCNGVKTTGTSEIISIGYTDHGDTYKCKVTVKVNSGSSSGLTGDTFWSNEITILKGIMNAPTYYSGSEDDYAVSCYRFSIVSMLDNTEISVTKPGEEHTFSNSDILYYKHDFGSRPLVVDGLEGDTEYEVAYKVPSSIPDLFDPCEGTFIVKTKAHTAVKYGLKDKYVYDKYFDGKGEAALPQNVHAKICEVCSPDLEHDKYTYFDIERHVDNDGDKKCDICGANYSDKGLYIESIGTIPGEKEVYTGKAIKPVAKVYVGDTLLTEGKDYKLTYKNNTKAFPYKEGTAGFEANKKNAPSVTATGIGNYKGTCTEYFTIEQFSLGNDNVSKPELLGTPASGVSVADIAVTCTDKDIKISPVVKVNGVTLKQGTDYKVKKLEKGIEENFLEDVSTLKAAGTCTLYVCGTGNYSGASKFNFAISNDKLISKIKFNKIPDQNYTGEPIAIDDIPFVSGKPAKTLKEEFGEGNYNVTYSNKLANGEVKEDNNTNIGTVTATITAKSGSGYCTTGSTTITYKIVGNDISKATVEKVPNQVYVGKAINPDLTVKYKTVSGDIKEPIEGTDYVVEYDGTNINAGTAKGTIRGIGKYSGSKKITFKITPYTVTDGDDKVIAYCNGGTEYKTVEYSPKGAKCSAVEAKFKTGSSVASLTEGVDYTVSYSNNTAVNEKKDGEWQNASKIPTAKFTFKGNFKGTRTVNFGIKQRSFGDGTAASGVTVKDVVVTYKKGKVYTPKFNVTVDGTALKEGEDYILQFTSGAEVSPKVDAGKYEMQIRGNGNYTGWCKTTYVITDKKPISTIKFNKIPDKNYTGYPIDITSDAIVAGTPAQTLSQAIGMYSIRYTNKLANGEIKEGNNTDIGTVTATISANDSSSPYCMTGSTTVTYRIVENNLKNAYLENKKIPDKVYTGREIILTRDELGLAFKNVDKSVEELEAGADYEVDYGGTNINVGTAKITVRGKGRYIGTKSFTFKIVPVDSSTDTDKITVDGKTKGNEDVTAVYSPNGAKPTPVVKFGDEVLTLNKDYTISYANNKTVANASDTKAPTMTLKFKGRFKGSRVIKYEIKPRDLGGDDFSVSVPDLAYVDKPGAWKSKVVVKDGKKTLKENIDYVVGYKYKSGGSIFATYYEMSDEMATSKKDIYVEITGKGNYSETSTINSSYHIGTINISKATVDAISGLQYIKEGQNLTFEYDPGDTCYFIKDLEGNTHTLTVRGPNKNTLSAATDYEIVWSGYSNNGKAGTASFTIKGKGEYYGIKVVKFSIGRREFAFWKNLLELFS